MLARALGGGFALLLAVAVAGAMAQSTAPSYVGTHFDRFEVLSNSNMTNARQLTPGYKQNLVGNSDGGEPSAPVWARKCSRDTQTVRFRRTVDLLGTPGDAYFDFSHEIGAKWESKSPLRTYRATVNGTVIAAGRVGKVQPSFIHTALTAAKLAAFRDGPNVVEVQVKKARSPRRVKKCNTKATNRLAVTFRLFGHFSADLGLVEPPPPDQYFKAASPHRTAFVTFNVWNHGPSGIRSGDFSAEISPADEVFLLGSGQPDPATGKVAPLGAPFTGCRVEHQTTTFKVYCTLGRMRVGDTGSVTLAVRRAFASTAGGESATFFGWQLSSSTPDPNFDNNSRHVRIVWCGSDATSEGCASAG